MKETSDATIPRPEVGHPEILAPRISAMPSIRIDWFDSANDIDDDLWTTCFPAHLEGKWWYVALEESNLEDQFTFSYALIHVNDKVAGIAPTFIMDVPVELVMPEFLVAILKVGGIFFPGLLYQRTLFVGSPCADEGTVGLMPGIELSDIAPALQYSLEKRAKEHKVPMIVWKDFTEADSKHLRHLCALDNLFELASYPGTEVPLPAGNLEDYFKSLKQSRRFNLRKKLKRSKQLGELEVEVVQNPDPRTQREVFDLFWQTYEKGKTKFERLTPRFFGHMSQQEHSYFVLLRDPETNKLKTFMLCFLLGDRVINKFIGIDYATMQGDWYPYFRLWEATVAWAMSLNSKSIQSGQTGYRAKTDVGHKLVPLINFCKHRNPLINKIYSMVARDVTWQSLDTDLADFLKAHPEAVESDG